MKKTARILGTSMFPEIKTVFLEKETGADKNHGKVKTIKET